MDTIHQPVVHSFEGAMGQIFHKKHDKARPYTEHIVTNEGISVTMASKMFKRKMELLTAEWTSFPQWDMDNLIMSNNNRSRAIGNKPTYKQNF